MAQFKKDRGEWPPEDEVDRKLRRTLDIARACLT